MLKPSFGSSEEPKEVIVYDPPCGRGAAHDGRVWVGPGRGDHQEGAAGTQRGP